MQSNLKQMLSFKMYKQYLQFMHTRHRSDCRCGRPHSIAERVFGFVGADDRPRCTVINHFSVVFFGTWSSLNIKILTIKVEIAYFLQVLHGRGPELTYLRIRN